MQGKSESKIGQHDRQDRVIQKQIRLRERVRVDVYLSVLVSFLRRKPLERAGAGRSWALFRLGAGAEGEGFPWRPSRWR
jgi:hypothetical protein